MNLCVIGQILTPKRLLFKFYTLSVTFAVMVDA